MLWRIDQMNQSDATGKKFSVARWDPLPQNGETSTAQAQQSRVPPPPLPQPPPLPIPPPPPAVPPPPPPPPDTPNNHTRYDVLIQTQDSNSMLFHRPPRGPPPRPLHSEIVHRTIPPAAPILPTDPPLPTVQRLSPPPPPPPLQPLSSDSVSMEGGGGRGRHHIVPAWMNSNRNGKWYHGASQQQNSSSQTHSLPSGVLAYNGRPSGSTSMATEVGWSWGSSASQTKNARLPPPPPPPPPTLPRNDPLFQTTPSGIPYTFRNTAQLTQSLHPTSHLANSHHHTPDPQSILATSIAGDTSGWNSNMPARRWNSQQMPFINQASQTGLSAVAAFSRNANIASSISFQHPHPRETPTAFVTSAIPSRQEVVKGPEIINELSEQPPAENVELQSEQNANVNPFTGSELRTRETAVDSSLSAIVIPDGLFRTHGNWDDALKQVASTNMSVSEPANTDVTESKDQSQTPDQYSDAAEDSDMEMSERSSTSESSKPIFQVEEQEEDDDDHDNKSSVLVEKNCEQTEANDKEVNQESSGIHSQFDPETVSGRSVDQAKKVAVNVKALEKVRVNAKIKLLKAKLAHERARQEALKKAESESRSAVPHINALLKGGTDSLFIQNIRTGPDDKVGFAKTNLIGDSDSEGELDELVEPEHPNNGVSTLTERMNELKDTIEMQTKLVDAVEKATGHLDSDKSSQHKGAKQAWKELQRRKTEAERMQTLSHLKHLVAKQEHMKMKKEAELQKTADDLAKCEQDLATSNEKISSIDRETEVLELQQKAVQALLARYVTQLAQARSRLYRLKEVQSNKNPAASS